MSRRTKMRRKPFKISGLIAQESLTARRPGCVDIEQAWLEEAQRLSRKLDGGTAEAIPAEAALANARAELSRVLRRNVAYVDSNCPVVIDQETRDDRTV